MSKAKFKKAMKEAMAKYDVDVNVAHRIAVSNYPEHIEKIAAAKLEIVFEEMAGEA